MKLEKIVGAAFVIVGLLFAVIGCFIYIEEQSKIDARIYTTARIVRIEERPTKDSDFPIEHTVYVTFAVEGQKIEAKLSGYRSSFSIGDDIEIYYFENDYQTVHEKGSDIFYLIFGAGGGGVAFAIGALILYREKKLSAMVLDNSSVVIHGKKKTLNGIFYLRKPHFCPKCNTQMEPITVSKVVNSNSPEAKQYNFRIKSGTYLIGNIEFSWKELKCPCCDYQLTIDEMKEVELSGLDSEQQQKHEKKEKLKVILFKMGMVLFAVLWLLVIFRK